MSRVAQIGPWLAGLALKHEAKDVDARAPRQLQLELTLHRARRVCESLNLNGALPLRTHLTHRVAHARSIDADSYCTLAVAGKLELTIWLAWAHGLAQAGVLEAHGNSLRIGPPPHRHSRILYVGFAIISSGNVWCVLAIERGALCG